MWEGLAYRQGFGCFKLLAKCRRDEGRERGAPTKQWSPELLMLQAAEGQGKVHTSGLTLVCNFRISGQVPNDSWHSASST